jgi:hypothetical protein
MEKWVLGYWTVGLVAIIVLKTKPIFHHSTIPLFHE